MNNKEYPIVDNAESFNAALGAVREAQKTFSTFTQEQVDKIFLPPRQPRAAQGYRLLKWRSRKPAWALLRTR